MFNLANYLNHNRNKYSYFLKWFAIQALIAVLGLYTADGIGFHNEYIVCVVQLNQMT